ncbi:hypothetical protein AXF42_Ash001265 [Apostasia shenzhenica]|uniref:Uncharacterized protein n=1 Tax=Apostasia shenzhenica TaxID=1088818 RepID=A0A2I0AUG5_9ASPA|nr:hypothetical protein AXF42_Ash001265 [Apostasia shenzhenica]
MRYFKSLGVAASSPRALSLSHSLPPRRTALHTTFMASVAPARLRVLLAIFLLCATRGEAMDQLIPIDGPWHELPPQFVWDACQLLVSLMNLYDLHGHRYVLVSTGGANWRLLWNGLHVYAANVVVRFYVRIAGGYLISGIAFVQGHVTLNSDQRIDYVPPSAITRTMFKIKYFVLAQHNFMN